VRGNRFYFLLIGLPMIGLLTLLDASKTVSYVALGALGLVGFTVVTVLNIRDDRRERAR
jgi:hypothetical protein